jgi:hypothetical protein
MDDLRPDAVAARVVAWHNRHPLARRITVAQVQAIGFVALPFVARPGAARSDALADVPTLPLADAEDGRPSDPAAGSLRARARARARPAPTSRDDPPFDSLPGSNDPFFNPPPAGSEPVGAVAKLRAWWARRSGRRRAAALLRGKARLRAKALKRAFSERFLPPLSPRLVARWALRHGRLEVAAIDPAALRRVLPDSRLLGDNGATTTLYLATAAIELGSQRARVLLGDGPAADAIGSRVMSPRRVGGVFASLALVAGLLAAPHLPPLPAALSQSIPRDMAALRATAPWRAAAAWMQRIQAEEAPLDSAGPRLAQADAMPPADAASAAADGTLHAAVVLAPEPAPEPPRDPAHDPAPAPEHAPAPESGPESGPAPHAAQPPAAAASAALFPDDPAPGEKPAARPGVPRATTRGGIPVLRPELDEDTKAAARQAVADLRAARGLPPAHPPAPAPAPAPVLVQPAPAPAPVQAAQPVQMAAPRVPAGAPAYALSTRLLRTRAESEQLMIAWRALLVADPRQALNISVMPAGDDWRVVCWPFANRPEAERARSLLLSRGLKSETVDF